MSTYIYSTAISKKDNGKDKHDTSVGEEKTFRGVLHASALALSLMDLSLGSAISII